MVVASGTRVVIVSKIGGLLVELLLGMCGVLKWR